MVVHIVLLCLILLFAVIFLYKYRNKKYFLFCSFLCITLVLGLRGRGVGEDTNHYLTLFEVFKGFDFKYLFSEGLQVRWSVWDETIEIGFALLMKVISCFTGSGQTFLFVVASLTCYLFARFIYRCIPNHVFLATIVFLCDSLYMSCFNGVRQMLAVGVVLNAYELIRDKKYIKSAVVFFLAFIIHKSSIIMIPFFLLHLVKDMKKTAINVIAIACLAPFSTEIMILLASKILPNYLIYFQQNFWTNKIRGTAVLWIIQIIICIYMIYSGVRNKREFFGIIGTVIYISIEVISLNIAAFSRITYYFRSFCIFLYPEFTTRLSKRFKTIYILFILALMILQYVSYAKQGSRMYTFFWQ